jgi:eukaryotic-like serine/threonine-protein kinase
VAADGAGIRFGQYVLLRRIARGGMAEVFLARQRGLEGFDRRVAVKRILPQLADAPDFIKMFLGEAKLAAQLSHPNIVHIYDFGKVDEDYFIAMEYVDGVHAGQLLKGGEDRLPPTLVARIGADAAAALHYAHELRAPNGRLVGLVHRDVSPANLMVSFDGVVKLCDFGIAKAAALGDQLTNPGQVRGKYAYMSPEQTTGIPLDGRSDVFSLAIVLWELLAGKTIVPRGDAVEAMRAIRDGRLTPIEVAVPGTPGALAAAITWGLQTRREHRPSAMELAEQLEAFIKSSPELATPMQLGAWLRARFTREATEEIGSLASEAQRGPAMQGHGEDRRAGLAGDRRWSAHPSVITSDTTSELMQLARSQAAAPAPAVAVSAAALASAGVAVHGPVSAGDGASARAAQAPMVIAPTLPAQAPTLYAPAASVAGGPPGSTIAIEGGATGGAAQGQPPVAAATAPTLFDPNALPVPVSSTQGSPLIGVPAPTVRRRPVGIALALVGFAVIASFVIAVAARGTPPAAPSSNGAPIASAPTDETPGATVPGASAQSATAPADDATITATVPRVAPSADERTILEVRTRPEGATVIVAGKRQVAPAQFALPPGRYAIDAESDGWMPERRSVDLVTGVRLVQDIVFTTPLHRARRVRTGKLTVRTTPPCEVFLGKRRLTETPFTDMEFEPATYALTFKHPKHAPVTKRVTITAGKTTRLSFALR